MSAKWIIVGAIIGVAAAYIRTRQAATSMAAGAPSQRSFSGGQGYGG